MAGDDDTALGLARGLPDGYHVVRGALFGERVKGLFIEKELGDNKEKGDNDKGYAYAEQGVCGCGEEVERNSITAAAVTQNTVSWIQPINALG